VALVRTGVSDECSVPIFRVTRTGELGTMLLFLRSLRRLLIAANVVPSSPILVTLIKETVPSSETSALTRSTNVTSQKMAFFNLCTDLKCFTASEHFNA
jgi:hypothetical protein